ncbi:hypothetical protein [Pseudomonas aeruginosa]|uniref:hypothetical protein n=1 Tax=Pseudomonas aeruginosa TaxID=287 RepID=UPI0005B5254A|nr:hypothetical protein [Pseudomonas aeruginosa]
MNKVHRYSVDARNLHPQGFLTGQGMGEVVHVEEFDKAAAESQTNAIALAGAQKEVATLRAMLGMAPEWMALTGPGQVKQGDMLRFKVGDSEIEAPAQLVLHEGTGREEIVYNRGKNHYFITDMAADGTSSHKSVMVKRGRARTGNEQLLRRLGQVIAWQCFGDCRMFSEEAVPAPAEVIAELNAVLKGAESGHA